MLNYRLLLKHIIAIVAMFASFCANAQENWHNATATLLYITVSAKVARIIKSNANS